MTTFLITFFCFYLWYVSGIAIGYHRLLSHRSLKCSKIFEYFFVFAGYLAYQGSPIWWASMHRAHHKHVDTPLDPHSPVFGFINGYAGWLIKHTTAYPAHINPREQCKDLYHDPLYVFLEQEGKPFQARNLANLIYVGFHASMVMIFGWQVGLGSLVASMVAFQVPLILNTCCHITKLGYRSFAIDDESVNVWWLGILALGEGWHNNHHAYPGSARAGVRPHEIDFCWALIKLGMMLGLVQEANQPQLAQIRINRPRKQGAVARLQRIKQLQKVG